MLKRAFPLLLVAALGATGCDPDGSRGILTPPLSEPLLTQILPGDLGAPEDCPRCLVPPTVLVRTTQAPARRLIAFPAEEGLEGFLVLMAPEPMGTTVWVRLNGRVLLLPSALPRAGLQEIRVPVVLAAENTLEVRSSAKPGTSLVFWVESGVNAAAVGAAVVAIPTGIPRAPGLVSDGEGLAILALADEETGAFQGAALYRAGSSRPALIRFDPDGTPTAVFMGGGAAYLDGWEMVSGVPTVRVTVPDAGSLPSTLQAVELPSHFSSVVEALPAPSPADEQGLETPTEGLRTISTGELLRAQAAVCSLERAGVMPPDWGACDPAMVDGLPTFWDSWTEEMGFDPFLATATAPLEDLGCEGQACVLDLVEVVESTIHEATPRRMVVIGGDGQTGPAGSTLPGLVRILLTNGSEAPLPGFLLRLDVITGSGIVPEDAGALALLPTDATGTGEATWTLGPETGEQFLRASTVSFLDLVVEITATAEDSAPAVSFRVTTASVAPTADMTATCAAEFGTGFTIADWSDVAAALSGGRTPAEIMGAGVAMVLNNGAGAFTPMFQSSTHHYTISTLGPGYPALGTLGPDLFWLSEDGMSHRILCTGSGG